MNLQEKLNNKGLRLTNPRREVVAILNKAAKPLTPQAIYQNSIERKSDIGLVSVYRTLELLSDLNLVRRVHGHDGCHGYVLASPGHHHHLICRKCGKAVEFSGSADLSEFVAKIQSETDYKIDEHILQLYGICPKCQKSRD